MQEKRVSSHRQYPTLVKGSSQLGFSWSDRFAMCRYTGRVVDERGGCCGEGQEQLNGAICIGMMTHVVRGSSRVAKAPTLLRVLHILVRSLVKKTRFCK